MKRRREREEKEEKEVEEVEKSCEIGERRKRGGKCEDMKKPREGVEDRRGWNREEKVIVIRDETSIEQFAVLSIPSS